MIFSLWFWFGISSSELKEAAWLLGCKGLTLSLHFLSFLNAQFRHLGLNRGLKLAVAEKDVDPVPFPASLLPILAPSSFVPLLMHPHPKFLGISRSPAHPTCGSLQGPSAVTKKDLSHLQPGHNIRVRRHFQQVSPRSCILWERSFIRRDVWEPAPGVLLPWTIPAPSSMVVFYLWSSGRILFRHPGIFMTPLCVYNAIALEQREINHSSFVSFQEFLMSMFLFICHVQMWGPWAI